VKVDHDRKKTLLRILPLVLLAAAAAFAVYAFIGRQAAADDHRRAEESAAEAEDLLAAGLARASRAEADRDAMAEKLAVETEALTEARSSLSALEERIAAAVDAEADIVVALSSYPGAWEDGLPALEGQIAAGQEMVALRAEQIEAVLAGDYDAFNRLQSQYADQVPAWNAGSGYYEALAGLPGFSYDDLSSILPAGLPRRSDLSEAVAAELTPPTGPAEIAGTLPEVIPCEPWSTGCVWDWEITWSESNMLGAYISEIGRRYVDRWGSTWVSESGEWFDKQILIEAGGTASYSSWVRTTPDEAPDLEGGTLIVSWRGMDNEGNAFSGEARATLAVRP